MHSKLTLLNKYCKGYGMSVNNSKTKFFALNCSLGERVPFITEQITVEWCDRYTYLGSLFTSDGSLSSALSAHAEAKVCHILKFVSFLKKNRDIPFQVKFKVFNAALMSSVLYGCESWLNGDLRPVEKLYNWAVKQLLGVRMTTCTDICYVELGLPPLKYLVIGKQRKFFQRLWEERQ